MDDARKPPRKRYRTLSPPPPPVADYEILADLDDPLAGVLWRGLRDVREWALTEPAARAELFAAPPTKAFREGLLYASAMAPELTRALSTFGGLRQSPRYVRVADLIQACVDVREWADERGLEQTCLVFAEAAAALDLDNPILASAAGRAARRAAEVDRAATWFHRAEKLAARNKNKREQIRALLGAGNLLREVGRFPEARALIARASKMAASTRRHRQAAEAAHDLLCIAIEEGEDVEFAEVERYVEDALANYPIHHPSIPRFVHDWSFYLVRRRLYSQALPLLASTVPLAKRPELQMLYSGTLARAAAGAARRDLWESSYDSVVALSGLHREFAATALANVAEGAQFVGEWERATNCAARAAEIARERREADVERGARAIHDAAIAHEAPPPQETPTEPMRIDAITQRIAALLQRRAKPARRPVQTDRDRATDPNPPTPPERRTSD